MFRAPYPAHLPHFSYVLDNVPGSIEQKARLLDIAPSTLRKYRQQGQAPRPIHLALFWESVWGIRTIEITSANQASTYFASYQAAKRENARLVKQMLSLEEEINAHKNGAANSPVFQIG